MASLIGILFLVYMSAVLGVYFLVPRKHRCLVLLISSLICFLVYSKFLTVFVLLTITTIYFAGFIISKLDSKFNCLKEGLEKEERKKLKNKFKHKKNVCVAITVIVNLAFIAVLKYSGMFVSMFEGILSWFNVTKHIPVLKIGLPLGISYYTLSAIGYLIDINRGKYPAELNFFKVALFVLYFPQLFEGPFGFFDKLSPQLYYGVDFDKKKCEKGFMMVIIGMFKTFVIADRLAIIASELFKNYMAYNGLIVILGILAFTFQLYAEFSGSIDVARGVSLMFGFELENNFDQPFFSKNVNEFWRRWHISLGTWFREYVFYPISMSKPLMKLSKNLHGKVKPFFESFIPTAIALFFVWFFNGLWHGASVKYIVYGMYWYLIMMIGMCFEPLFKKVFSKCKIEDSPKKVKILNCLRIVRTFIIVNLGFMLFRANSVLDAVKMFGSIFTSGKLNLISIIDVYDLVLSVLMVALILIVDALKERKVDLYNFVLKQNYILRTAIYVVIIFAIIIFGAYGDGYVPVDPIYGGF